MKESDMSILDIILILFVVGTLSVGAYILLRRRIQSVEQLPPLSPINETKDLVKNRVMQKIKDFQSSALSYYLYEQSQIDDLEPNQIKEIFAKYGLVKERPIFKATELSDLGSQYYRIDEIIKKYLDEVNYREHTDFLPIDRLELVIYDDAEKTAKKILGSFV